MHFPGRSIARADAIDRTGCLGVVRGIGRDVRRSLDSLGPVIDCGRISPAACEVAVALATEAAEPGILDVATRIVVDDMCPPTVVCDRKYPFESLVVFVTAGADTTGWYDYHVTGPAPDMPTDAARWRESIGESIPDHIVALLQANEP